MTGAPRIALLWMACLVIAVSVHLPAAAALPRDRTEVRELIEAGRYLEAEDAAREQVESFGDSPGEALDKAQALDLWVEARWRNFKSWHPGTLEAAEWSEKIRVQHGGSETAEVADSLFHQARVLDEWARFGEAQALYERAIALYRRTVGDGDPRTAIAEAYLGAMLVELAQLRAAEPHLEHSLRALEEAYGPQHPAVTTALVPLAWLEKYRRNVDRAEMLFERALEIREKALGPNHPDVAEVLDGLTRLRWETTSLAAAREAGRRAEAIRLAAFGPNHPSLAYNYVLLWWAETSPSEAQRCLVKAREVAEAGFPPDHPKVALVLTYYALADDMEGGFAASREAFERALHIYETAYGPDHWRVATVLGNMSGLWHSLGDLERFEQSGRRAAQIYASSEVIRFPASYLDRQTERLEDRGEIALEEAIRRGEEAIALAEEVHEPLFHLASLLQTQADRLVRAGRWLEAAETYERTIAVRETHAGPDHMHLMDPLREYADLQARLGNFERALSLNRRALDVLVQQLGPEHLQLQFSMDLEARLLWSQGDLEAAFAMAQRLDGLLRQNLAEAMLGLPERQSLGLLAWQAWQRDLMISAAVADPEGSWSLPAAEAVARSRGLVLDALARRHQGARSMTDPRVARLVDELEAARSGLAHLAVAGNRGEGAEAYQRQLEAARQQKERAEWALAAYDQRFRQRREQSVAGVAEVVASVPAGGALVSFLKYNRFEPPSPEAAPSWPLESTPAYAAFVLRSGETTPRAVDLGPAQPVDERIRRLSELTWGVAASADRSPRRSVASYRSEGEALRRRIWDPLASLLEGIERVFVVPDGELHLLPFGALPMGESGYLIESGAGIHYLSTERDLVEPETPDLPSSQGLLAMGHPDYEEPNLFAALARDESEVFRLARADVPQTEGVFRGQRASCGDFGSLRFSALPASLSELAVIESSWRQTSANPAVAVLDGARANEAAFKARASGNRVLHLATHGFFLGGECSPEARVEHGQLLENPLVLSGLALAGANHREAAGPAEEDGILTAEEIAALDLEGVQWAVLSGCETGVGEAMAGEGVFGLRRAFQIAGARTVIMSLWPVDDESTRDWMAALYRHRFAAGATTLEAVHEASLELLAGRRAAGLSTHPFYWAGFVAAGDWR